MKDRRAAEATLAALATLIAAWPISTLLATPTWLGGTVLLLAVIAASGVSARSVALHGWQVLMVQLVCAVLTAGGIYGRGHLWHGLPTLKTLEYAGKLVGEGLDTVQKYAAPVPTTPGLAFIVACSLALVALAVDYLAVTRRSPSLAGLLLLTAFLSSAANSDSPLPFYFFLAAGAMWLVLVAREGNTMLREWGTTVAVARTPVREGLTSQGGYSYSSVARTLGVMALVAAVGLPVVLPQAPPAFLLAGLGHRVSGGGGSGTVGFSLSLDVASDLRSQSTNPVLQYQTTDPSPPPLRVAVSSVYNSGRGVWEPRTRSQQTLPGKRSLPAPRGLSVAIPRKPFTMRFEQNRLEEPNLAAPYPLLSADLDDIGWGLDRQTQDVKVAERPESYTVSYWRLEPTPAMLRGASATPGEGSGIGEPDVSGDEDVSADVDIFGVISDLSKRLTAGKASAYDQAMAIQEYLRSTGGFTYSLQLAPQGTDRSGNRENLDPLTHFLNTKQGYCVQFATAMVMLSRAAGIHARMAIGFLPGTFSEGVWTVSASDAHTWPELYLDGIGWTRFEPTPSRATPPPYALSPTPSATSGGGPSVGRTAAPVDPRNARPDTGKTSTGDTAPDVGLSLTAVLRGLTHGWGLVLLGLLAGLLGSLVVPTAARWRRRRELTTARTPARRVEVQWELLTSSLADLGIEPAPSRTPRQLRAYYDREAMLDGPASEALGRVTQTVERSRYSTSAPVPDGLAADARQVLRAAAANRRRSDRLRATLWPSGGLAQLRSARADLAWSVRTFLHDVSAIVRQRLGRR